MRLTNVSQMQTQPGRLFSYAMTVQPPAAGAEETLPVSFDQDRHVSFGSRPGSWMAVSFVLPFYAEREEISEAWHVVIARHSTLRTAFSWKADETNAESGEHPAAPDSGVPEDAQWRSGGPVTRLRLSTVDVVPGTWEQLGSTAPRRATAGFTAPDPGEAEEADGEDGTLTAEQVRAALRAHFDAVCDPFAAPSYRLCVIEDPEGGRTPQMVIGSDHSHVDAWSLLVLIRDLTAVMGNLREGLDAEEGLQVAEPFAAHTTLLENRPFPPAEVVARWREVIDAGGDTMPTFPLGLGDLSQGADEVVEVRDVYDSAELARLEAHAAEHGVRLIAVAVSVMTRLARQLGDGQPLRTVFPVHSRDDPRWFDSVGWFITNSVLENDDDSYAASYAAVKEAAKLGSYPLAPIMRPYGGMPQDPCMFAMSWLDHRKLPINVDDALNPQHVSAVIRTDGVMIWFVVNESGLHLRCRYPDTYEARASMRTWLAGLVYGMRAPLVTAIPTVRRRR